jgi:ABC-type uncharacterized transport system substrate-binding protein
MPLASAITLIDPVLQFSRSPPSNMPIACSWGPSSNGTELLDSLAPDVVLVNGTPASAAVQQETQTIPIVFVGTADPVGQGFVASLAHPGGNITGFTDEEPTMASKRLELLKEIAPGVARVAVIFNGCSPLSFLDF